MVRLLRLLIFGHDHVYEIHDKAEMSCQGQVKSRIYVLRCKTCGRMKNHTAGVQDGWA